jgi:hypothetical protein
MPLSRRDRIGTVGRLQKITAVELTQYSPGYLGTPADRGGGCGANEHSAEITARIPNMKSFVCPISEPNSATPRTLPVCRAELSTPARNFSTLPSSSDAAVQPTSAAKRPITATTLDAQQRQAGCGRKDGRRPPQLSRVRQIARTAAATSANEGMGT